MASYHWVAEKAIPILMKHPTMGAKKLQEELEDKYDITIGYGTVHMGFVIAGEKNSWDMGRKFWLFVQLQGRD